MVRDPISLSNLQLFVACVAIWGSTWIAITFQLGKVAPEASVFYRFLLRRFHLEALDIEVVEQDFQFLVDNKVPKESAEELLSTLQFYAAFEKRLIVPQSA